ncbi:hypothetical protein PPERSA_11838 [Pseudocohnilembus persalinus]|uniref:Uncharacterized protein n=1 Tax=Pseudocohnilembus persalinus TaxID=266149 RepID=A0A0V0QJW1_PSEPJ|nr:hypothetical protein PPERSA_11838 [Pseudocohnilembus persalinus]|eukprot:KRX02498.1 hypothetical protein PPERSA_11838 [Pseudocohnilembus persalinus]
MSDRIEIQSNAADNPKMREIYDILLMAGYFRIRIPSLNDFDKIMGGLAWCITCSNFDIDIEYNDEMKLGEKIKIGEKICAVLKQMQCPYSLQSFQIQGLDANSIFPVIQWLIKFVYETREQRQDFNKKMSVFLGKNVYKQFQINERKEKLSLLDMQKQYYAETEPRITKNNKIKKLDKQDPLRVYSGLIEFGDVTAFKTYNKLCSIMSGKISLEDKGGKISQKASQFEQSQDIQNAKGGKNDKNQLDVTNLLFHGSTSQKDSDQNQVQNQDEDLVLDQDLIANFKDIANIGGTGGNISSKLMQLIDQDQINNALSEQQQKANEQQNDEDDPLNIARIILNEKKFHEGQIIAMNKKIEQMTRELEEISDELYGIKEKETTTNKQYDEYVENFDQLNQLHNNMSQQLDKLKSGISEQEKLQTEKLVEKKIELEQQKKALKKSIKQQQEELQKQEEKVSTEIPQWEQTDDYINQLYQDVAEKKEKHEEKFKQLAQLNKEIQVLQRKIESVPSATEIAQYHQKLQELFENIHLENQRYRDKYIKYNASTDVLNLTKQYVEIMRTFKENFQNCRSSKTQRESFIQDLTETRKGLMANLDKSIKFENKLNKNREDKQTQLIQQQNLERDYFKLLKELKMEFEKGDEIQNNIVVLQTQLKQLQNSQ